MKTLGTIILTAFISIAGFAQDTLYTTKGKTINGRITEINQDEIKYKKASNPDGPTYVIPKSDIVLIHYKNGSKDVFQSSEVASNNNNNSSNNNSNQNNNAPQNSGYSDPVYVNSTPNVNVVLGGAPYMAYGGYGGYGGWGLGLGWGGWGWGGGYYHRPFYRGGYYGYRGGYHGGFHGGGFHGGGFHGGGHHR